jgi:hypothetical protein
MVVPTEQSWEAYRLLIVSSVDRIEASQKSLATDLDRKFVDLDRKFAEIQRDITEQKIEAAARGGKLGALWGMFTGAASAVISYMVLKILESH